LNKKKIFNDPIYGFLTIPSELIFDIIDHPIFQRLRRIRQLGLTDLVYPGALHTRFHHALGAMHLMGIALDTLQSKGHAISAEEREAAQIAILLHDIGHGPFSHALEFTLMEAVSHETISRLIMQKFNVMLDGKLDLTIAMFNNTYHRRFFHDLISSQLDVDRLDYLQRDSFFTGVSEGTIGADRILKMLDLKDDKLVIEEKGIYSIENFLTARRLMYWQVYLHKTTVSSEKMMIAIIRRSKWLIQNGIEVYAGKTLKVFLKNNITCSDFESNAVYLDEFCKLDDFDIWGAIKNWADCEDFTLSYLCQSLLNRKLFKIQITDEEPDAGRIEQIKENAKSVFGVKTDEVKNFLFTGIISNAAYVSKGQSINVLTKKGKVVDVAEASDLPNIKALSKIVTKHYICCPKKVYL
jgi:HD superfamily phosphohydrolase